MNAGDDPDRQPSLEHGRVIGDPTRVVHVRGHVVARTDLEEPRERDQADQEPTGEDDAADDGEDVDGLGAFHGAGAGPLYLGVLTPRGILPLSHMLTPT